MKLADIKFEKIAQAMCELDDEIWEKYNPNSTIDATGRTRWNAALWLRSDISTILTQNGDVENTAKEILTIIEESECGREIFSNYINMNDIIEEAVIRLNFASAFRTVREGRQLSSKIGYGLSKKDLSELAKLHKANRFRKKIEDLLEDCNFHYECGEFANGRYEEFIK